MRQVLFVLMVFIGAGVAIGHGVWGDNNYNIASTYALDKTTGISCGENPGDCWFTTQFSSGELRYFWQEATKNTQFTVDGKPVEITDVQVFYKYYGYDEYRGSPITCPPPRLFYGNITYYPGGIENSQTYVAPIPTPTPVFAFPYEFCGNGCLICTDHLGNCTYIPGKTRPTLTPIPTPCAGLSERTAYSFCGKITINSSTEFDRLLKDIEKHSYHIQMGWMHLDYEYAHKTYDNTLPASVNICMGTVPGDNFPIGSEWEGKMAYIIDECAPLGDCDFDTLALMPTPALTPTPILAFPYEFCANGCLICTDHLGNCTYIHGKPTPTPG